MFGCFFFTFKEILQQVLAQSVFVASTMIFVYKRSVISTLFLAVVQQVLFPCHSSMIPGFLLNFSLVPDHTGFIMIPRFSPTSQEQAARWIANVI